MKPAHPFLYLVLLGLLHPSSAVWAFTFEDEPAARAQFDLMNEALRSAETLSFSCQFQKEALGIGEKACTYHVWLKKPNLLRMETVSTTGEKSGVMVGDGENLWIHWPAGRPRFEAIKEPDSSLAERMTSYMQKPAQRADRISIWHEAPLLGGGMGFPIVEVSVFHGYVDSIDEHLDAVRGLGSETIDGHECTKIELSAFDHQRSIYLWLSKQDHLPRKLIELVRLDHEVITHEIWMSVKVGEEISDSMFRWSPPEGWRRWRLPDDEESWPNLGTPAPDFELTSVDGRRARLSDYRGRSVWLNFWRIGCPGCISEIPYLQTMHERYSDSGLTVIGVNVSDDRKLLMKFLEEREVSYLNILDTTDEAQKLCMEDYGVGGIPMNCLIDAEGKVVEIWVGHSPQRAEEALGKVGIETAR